MGHVRDRWMKRGPSGRKVRDPEHWGRGDRWQARWVESGREKAATFPTKDAAEQHLARVATGKVRRRRVPVSVAEYAEVWQAERIHYAASTRDTVRYKLHANVLPAIGDKRLDEVSRADVQRMVAGWPGAPATVRQSFSFVTSMFQTALEDGLVSESPCVGVKLPKKVRHLVVPLTASQVQQIRDAVAPWYRAMVTLGAATGLRGGELRGLTVDRVTGDVLRVDRQLVGVDHGRPVFAPPKSAASVRNVSMGAVARAALLKHMADYPPGVEGILFTTRQHGPITRKMAAAQWAKATESMGTRVVGEGWHALRHAHASALIRAGLSPTAVAHRLGHANAATTLGVYAHLWPDDEARATAATDAFLTDELGRLETS